MTVPDLLIATGRDLGRRNITHCPFHDDRMPSFQFGDYWWHCYAGCGRGNAKDLAQRLGVDEEELTRPLRTLEGDTAGLLELPQIIRLTDRLTNEVRVDYWVMDHDASVAHRRAERWQVMALRLLAVMQSDAALWERLDDALDQVLARSRAYYDIAHRFYGAWPWPCGCYGDARRVAPV